MSLLEWLFESRDPGPVGDVQYGQPEPDEDEEPPKRGWVWAMTIAGLVLLGVCLYGVLHDWTNLSSFQLVWRLILLTLYVFVGFYVTIRPDYSNMGWLGGAIDNPFRFSDDANRTLAVLQVLLLPGKLMAYGLIMGWLIGRYYWRRFRRSRR